MMKHLKMKYEREIVENFFDNSTKNGKMISTFFRKEYGIDIRQ